MAQTFKKMAHTSIAKKSRNSKKKEVVDSAKPSEDAKYWQSEIETLKGMSRLTREEQLDKVIDMVIERQGYPDTPELRAFIKQQLYELEVD